MAVVYDDASLDLFAFAKASRGAWKTLWIVNSEVSAAQQRILRRFGEVVTVPPEDPDGAATTLRRHAPDGIIALVDNHLEWTSQVADSLGLRFHDARTVDNLTDKRAQRAALHRGGVPTPRQWVVTESHPPPAVELPADIAYPVVVKPRDGASSRDTFRANSKDDLLTKLAAVAQRSDPVRDLVIEEYLRDGWARAERPVADFVSVESIASRGRFSCLAVSGKLPLAEPFRETGDFIPSLLDPDALAEVVSTAHTAAAALGVTDSALHTEIKMTPDGPRVIEVNGRIGGDVAQNLANATGYSIYQAAVDAALGTFTGVPGPLPTTGVAFDYEPQPPVWASRIERIAHVHKAGRLDGVLGAALRRHPGDSVDWRDGTLGRVISFRGLVPDHERMFELIDEIDATLEITYR